MGNWKVKFRKTALRTISKLDRETKGKVIDYLQDRIEGGVDPRRFGKALSKNMWGSGGIE